MGRFTPIAFAVAIVAVSWLWAEHRPLLGTDTNLGVPTDTLRRPSIPIESRDLVPRYQAEIQGAVRRHWPSEWQEYDLHWRAQLLAESSLDEKTCERANRVGAKCLAQITPITARELERLGFLGDTRADAVASIHGGAFYMAHLDRQNRRIFDVGTAMDRLVNAQVAYITGPGNFRSAARSARNPHEGHFSGGVRWEGDIDHHLEREISKENYSDVKSYVAKIASLAVMLATKGVVRVEVTL